MLRRRLLLLGVMVATWMAVPAGAAEVDTLYVTAQASGAAILAVDVASGDRRAIELYDYPVIIQIRAGAMTPDGQLYLTAENAALSPTVVRYDPATGAVVGISGYVDRTSNEPRGTGPDFEPGIAEMAVGAWGWVHPLRSFLGPMAVDVVSGNRRVVSQSTEPAVGDGVEMTQPVDLLVESANSLLVADRFQGLIRVRMSDGRRTIAHRFVDIVESSHRIDRLPDGRVVHASGRGDGHEVSVFDRGLVELSRLSGPERGVGPDFVAIHDLVVGPDGTVYVLDLGLGPGAIVAVAPASGDRRVVTGGPQRRGDGPDFFIANERPIFVDLPGSVPFLAPRRASRRVQ